MERFLPSIYTDDFRDNTIVVTTDAAGTGYIRRLETEGVNVWVLPTANMKVPFPNSGKSATMLALLESTLKVAAN